MRAIAVRMGMNITEQPTSKDNANCWLLVAFQQVEYGVRLVPETNLKL